ncbi:6029_t:CDS:2 [Cetraspora pellucida]|uniref:6029_t:CDS:1 n=1 Tax=Cetraspora pellucida TaxID=1433469 RepID=A0A9N9CLH1_9GLOM|nr:6029_t:CDS:2 [Cetraspora pellucida]
MATRIASDIIILVGLPQNEDAVSELVYDIPYYCDQVSIILFMIGILSAIPHTRLAGNPLQKTTNSKKSFRITISSHKTMIWFFRIYSIIIFPSLATLGLLTGYFRSQWAQAPKPYQKQDHDNMMFEACINSAHYMVHAVGSASLAFCFIYFGRKVKGFAEASIALLMDTDMDSSKYGRLRLMRNSITRLNVINGFFCAKYLLDCFGAIAISLYLNIILLTPWASKIVAVMITIISSCSMILCIILVLYGQTNPEDAFDLSFIQVSPSQRHFSFGVWSVSGDSNNQQFDKNDSVLLPPPPSYNDNETQETSRKSPMKRNYRYSLSSSSINRNSILPEIVVSTPDVVKKPTKNGEKSEFVAAWILDQHERSSVTD